MLEELWLCSKNGYEHYYDGESGTGYLAWRVKTIQRGLAKDRRASFEVLKLLKCFYCDRDKERLLKRGLEDQL